MRSDSAIPTRSRQSERLTSVLLTCGIFSSLYYVAINIIVPFFYDGYSYTTLTVSELSAIGAPTRSLWIGLATVYVISFGLFGYGLLLSAKGNLKLLIVGVLIMVYSLINSYWPPMHMRGSVTSLTDTLHLVWAGVTVALMIIIMGVGAAALGRSFKVYTAVTIAANTVFGILTSLEAPGVPINAPTPHIGIWERVNIGVFMVWVIVFAIEVRNRNMQLKSGVG